MTREKMKQFVLDSLKDYDRDKLIDVIVDLGITNNKLVENNINHLEYRIGNVSDKIKNLLSEYDKMEK